MKSYEQQSRFQLTVTMDNTAEIIGDGTEFLPALLAKHVVESIDVPTLSEYDLNEDGVVDRFLILHSTLAQEQGSGSSNRIWSHFTSFSEPIKNGDVTFEHYTNVIHAAWNQWIWNDFARNDAPIRSIRPLSCS